MAAEEMVMVQQQQQAQQQVQQQHMSPVDQTGMAEYTQQQHQQHQQQHHQQQQHAATESQHRAQQDPGSIKELLSPARAQADAGHGHGRGDPTAGGSANGSLGIPDSAVIHVPESSPPAGAVSSSGQSLAAVATSIPMSRPSLPPATTLPHLPPPPPPLHSAPMAMTMHHAHPAHLGYQPYPGATTTGLVPLQFAPAPAPASPTYRGVPGAPAVPVPNMAASQHSMLFSAAAGFHYMPPIPSPRGYPVPVMGAHPYLRGMSPGYGHPGADPTNGAGNSAGSIAPQAMTQPGPGDGAEQQQHKSPVDQQQQQQQQQQQLQHPQQQQVVEGGDGSGAPSPKMAAAAAAAAVAVVAAMQSQGTPAPPFDPTAPFTVHPSHNTLLPPAASGSGHGHGNISLEPVCNRGPPMYFLQEGFAEVTARNLKKRVTGDISAIHVDGKGGIWVAFDGQKVYAEFDNLTVPMKTWVGIMFRKVMSDEAAKAAASPAVLAAAAAILQRDLNRKTRRAHNGVTSMGDSAAASPVQRRARVESRSPSPETIISYKRRRQSEQERHSSSYSYSRAQGQSYLGDAPDQPAERERERDREFTLPLPPPRGIEDTFAFVAPPSTSTDYTQVLTNEFAGTLKRVVADLEAKYADLRSVCTALHAENLQLKAETGATHIAEQLAMAKTEISRLQEQNLELEATVREQAAALDTIRKCLPH
ncbi:hypothetical protein H9P43_004702 [Blastocladiella emersonii ATCC 22665]|nr:hypothetical protein H9P43_004702 [Blastocladiella emersonii ATCC 22665]